MSCPADDRSASAAPPLLQNLSWQTWFADGVRFVVAPLILFLSGFFTTDFFLSGVYTWPRTSRVLVLTITVAILSYEFVYKEPKAGPGAAEPLKRLLYSCLLPYGAGILALVALVQIAS